VLRDVTHRVEQRAHVGPVAMRDRNSPHVGERHAEVSAVPQKERALRPGVEKQLVATVARGGGQDKGQTTLGAAERDAARTRQEEEQISPGAISQIRASAIPGWPANPSTSTSAHPRRS